MKHKLLTLMLWAVLALSLFGCSKPAEETQPPATEPPATEPSADEIYAEACSVLGQESDLVLRITSRKTTTVGGEHFVEESEQTLSYSGLGTENLKIHSEETVDYSNVYYADFDEIYTDGTLYVALLDSSYFSGALTAEECAARYVPALQLNAEHYGSITASASETFVTLTFSEAAAGESWAVPEDAQLLEASGTAIVNHDHQIQKTRYRAEYTYGNAQIELDVEVYVEPEATAIQAPENAADYVPLEYVDAARISEQAIGYMLQAESYCVSSLESMMTYAGGVIRNQSTVTDYYAGEEETLAKIDTGVYLMDYATDQSQSYDQEEVYRDGVCTVTIDDGEPEVYSNVTDDMIVSFCQDQLVSHMLDLRLWQDASATDLGSVYLIECTLNEEFSETMREYINLTFWNDENFLDGFASAYESKETSCYLAVDKYTGLPTAAGYLYEGQHTIEGSDYLLTMQSDQSIETPALEAYHTITEEMLPEEEPENKATPLFYHVTGDSGQEMWLLGTIHVGDARTAYLPQEIYDAFEASDALALEFSSRGFDAQLEADEALSDQVSNSYYYSDGTAADKLGDEELYDTALMYMKATGNYNINTPYMKLAIWSQSIDNFYSRQAYRLTSQQGVDNRLERLAEEQGKEIRDVESGLFQVQMLTGWSDALQIELLKDSLGTEPEESWESLNDLYEKWCAGDEAVLREELSSEVDTSEMTEEELAEYEKLKPLYEEYHKAMSHDRNEDMLQVAIDYLENGDVVFYAVGLAHLLDDTNGLVDTLREAGYTVELVSYS